jgi:adenylosuccinate synthase
MIREAWIVIDLGFGDAGKGAVVDFLARDRKADLVVRFNGGAQAGHNVVTDDGRHHTFSQFGSGLLAGVPTLLGPAFLLHPLGMWAEAQHLIDLGIRDPWSGVTVDRRARLITPYQQAAGRAREQLRGAAAHGSCGVGIGECVADSFVEGADVLQASDLMDAGRLRRQLQRQREAKRAELQGLGCDDLSLFDDAGLIDRVIATWGAVGRRLTLTTPNQTEERIRESRCALFEGAQGVLLDEVWGFHPHTTWSDCTPRGAMALLHDRPARRLGLLRSYAVRHGAGPFPSEGLVRMSEEHNNDFGSQGRFRVGALDLVLLRYAIAVCGGVDGLVINCLDRLARGPIVMGYNGLSTLEPGAAADLGHRQRLGEWLRGARPGFADGNIVDAVQAATGLDVWIQGWGPTAAGKQWNLARPMRFGRSVG